MQGKKILVIDDEKDLVKLLEYNFKKEGYEVLSAFTGEDGLKTASQALPDAIVLDWMLPKIDGLEVCRMLKLNPKTKAIPVLMLTARGSETDQVVGLEIGADDYVLKPFNIQVLSARVKKLLQRRAEPESNAPIKAGTVLIDAEKQKVTVKGREAALTTLEFRILHFLARHPGRVFSRNQLLDGAWKQETFVVDRTVDVHIKSIRKKLGPQGDCIETIWGTGYRFRENEAK